MQNFDKLKKLLNRPFPKAKLTGTDIPLFAPRVPEKKRKEDKYEKDFTSQDKYLGVYAYGYQTLHRGGGDSLYRTISSIILSNIDRQSQHSFLDLGCGTGRTLYDLVELYPASSFIGLDYSYNMLIRSREILLENSLKPVDLSKYGFTSKAIITTKQATNLNLIQGSAFDIPFKSEVFDCVTNTYLIDRVVKYKNNLAQDMVKETLQESIRVLKRGGLFILTNPLNFQYPGAWKKFRTRQSLINLISKLGIKIKEYFSDLVFRELSDGYGNYIDWNTLVIWGFKK